jgi:hypothetical protein
MFKSSVKVLNCLIPLFRKPKTFDTMPLSRTTILPVDDPNSAEILLDTDLARPATTLMFIIGDTDAINSDISRADYWANEVLIDFDRWVVWVKDRELLRVKISALLDNSDDPDTGMDYDDIKCFSLSPVSRKATGVIHKNVELTDFRLSRSFILAEAIDGFN